jgi:hypothetical protein
MDVQEIISVIVAVNPASTITLIVEHKVQQCVWYCSATTVYTFGGSAAVLLAVLPTGLTSAVNTIIKQ